MKHGEKKKLKISSLLLGVLVIIAIILIVMIITNINERNKNEKLLQEVVAKVETLKPEEKDKQISYIEYEGYQVIGNIEIPEIDIKYPILIESNEDSLTKSVTRVGDGKVNEIGNLCIAGHNYIDGSMFGQIDKLENGDEIYIIDLYGNKQRYIVFNKYITNPNDVSVLESTEKNKKEVTLVTCTNGNKNRLIIKAKEA